MRLLDHEVADHAQLVNFPHADYNASLNRRDAAVHNAATRFAALAHNAFAPQRCLIIVACALLLSAVLFAAAAAQAQYSAGAAAAIITFVLALILRSTSAEFLRHKAGLKLVAQDY